MTSPRPSLPRRFAFATVTAAAASTALVCSSCSSSSNAPTQVYISSTLGINPAGQSATCNIDEPGAPFFNVGSGTLPDVSLVTTGTAEDGGQPLSATCSVKAASAADTFDVTLQVSLGGTESLYIAGPLQNMAGTTQSGITASFTQLQNGSYNGACTVVLSDAFTPPLTNGRVVGTLLCPTIANEGNNDTCYATATFLFQNCAE